jgi:hypothetical protein
MDCPGLSRSSISAEANGKTSNRSLITCARSAGRTSMHIQPLAAENPPGKNRDEEISLDLDAQIVVDPLQEAKGTVSALPL